MSDFLTHYRHDLARSIEVIPLDRVQQVIDVFDDAQIGRAHV